MSEVRSQKSEAAEIGIVHSAKSIAYLRRHFVFFSMHFLACHSHKAAATALCVFSLLIFSPAFQATGKETEADIKKKQIEQIETDLNREKEKFHKFDVKEKDILEQLSLIENEINEKRKIIHEIDYRIGSKKKELKINQKKLNELESALNKIENLLAERLVAFYKNAKRGYMKVLLVTEDLDLLNHNLKYLRVIMDRDRDMMRELAHKKADYKSQMSVIEEQLDAVGQLEESENSNLGDLKQTLEKEVLLLAKIHQEKEFYEVAVKELQSAADYLKDTISNLENNQKYNKVSLPKGFSSSKGKLPYPLKGKIFKNVKKKGQSTFEKYKGVYIEGHFRSEVKAIYPGRVDYSGILKGYGQVIVINHGERYFTISAYLNERKKSEGDRVSPGDVIGYVGEAGLTTGPALYFEIRKGEENLDPLKWLIKDN